MTHKYASETPEHLLYPQEPHTWAEESFKDYLRWAVEAKASDINVVPGDPVWLKVHGAWYKTTSRDVTLEEVDHLLNKAKGLDSAANRAKTGDAQDFRYEITNPAGGRRARFGFRVNGTGVRDGLTSGVNLVMRTIPGVPPSLDDMDVEPGLRESLFPLAGLVLVTGVMGSGKSTLIAAAIRWISENQRRFICTYEAPIEFNLRAIPKRMGPLVQSEIGEHLRTWKDAPRNSTRRAGDVMLYGELRDLETMAGALEQSEVGNTVYATLHTRSVPETANRILNSFPPEQQGTAKSTLVGSMRLFVAQKLVVNPKGGRTALREFLVVDQDMRMELYGTPIEKFIPTMDRFLQNKGQPMLRAAERAREEGTISDETLDEIRRERELQLEAIRRAAAA